MPFSQPHKGEGLQCSLGNGNQPNSRTTHRVVELACPTLTKGIQRKIQLMYFCLQKRTWNPKLRAGWRNQREVDPDCSCSQRPLPLDSHRGCFYKHVMAHAAALTTGLGLLWFQPPAQPRAALLFPWVLRRCARSHPTLSPHPPPPLQGQQTFCMWGGVRRVGFSLSTLAVQTARSITSGFLQVWSGIS